VRIALMSPWNDCCGVAVHAWLLGSAWLRAGHELIVFAPLDEVLKGRMPVDAPDEDFVRRCWVMHQHADRLEEAPELFLDMSPLLEEGFDVLFVEKPCSAPLRGLTHIIHELKQKGPVVAIMHAGVVPRPKAFYQIRWDLATVFDKRFYNLYGRLINARRVEIVPYPFHPVVEGDKKAARHALDLPLEAPLLLAFGVRAKHLWPIMPYLAHLADERGLKLLIIAKHGEGLRHALALSTRYGFVEVRRAAPHYEELYTYHHAVDAVLLHRPPADYVPISSTVHLCLGAMRPLICPDNNYFEVYDGAVVKYRDPEDMVAKLELVLEGGALVEEVLRKARRLIEGRTAKEVAEQLLKLALEAGRA